jgi:hypothetical protein
MSELAHVRALPITDGKTLLSAIRGGTYLDILLAQREEIVETSPDQKGPAKAALHRQLTLISKEIEAIRAAEENADSVIARTPDEIWDPLTPL